ncbi:mucin-17 isoform X2 [Cryptotermes secundus]|nr:mucin-17 isoform X2 [Cryptotermes secundus]
MSDVMLPNSNISNGLPVYGGNNLKGNSYDCGSTIEFPPSDYHILNENLWSEIPAILPGAQQNVVSNGSAIFPPSQSHYNYTFTPVDATLLSNGTSVQDNYAFESPKSFRGIPEDEELLPNIDTCEARTANAYSERGQNTVLQECGLNDDTYFGMGENIQDTANTSDDLMPGYYRKGGADLLITGGYPVTRSPGSFPVGGNLDQLLRQMSNKESERVTSVPVTEVTSSVTAVAKHESDREEVPTKDGTENVQEVIDALETQLDSKLNDAVRGVRVANGNCYVCLAEEDNAGALLETGLILRGAKIKLEDVSHDSIIVAFSGVPHDVSDGSVARAVASHGTVIGEVERRLYKGVDTGERLVRLKPADADIGTIPSTINLGGSKATLRILKPEEIKELCSAWVPESPSTTGATEDDKKTSTSKVEIPNGDSPAKSLDSSFSTDRYRSQLNVRLKLPNPKTNRSLENIFDSTADVTQHNTSLPIIDARDTASVKVAPPKILSETTLSEPRNKKSSCERRFNFDTSGSALSHKLPYQQQEELTHAPSDHGTRPKEIVTEVCSQKSKEPEVHQLVGKNKVLKTHSPKQFQSSPEIARNHVPNIFSKLPHGKFKCQNPQFFSTTDESTESVGLNLKTSPNLQNNPFMGNTGTLSCSSRNPITPTQANPFISSTPNPDQGIVFQDFTPHDEQRSQCHNSQHFPHFQSSSNLPPDLKILTSYDHQRQFFLPLGTSNSRACSPYSHINASYSHNTQPSNIAFINNEAVYMPNSTPASFSGTPSSFPINIAPFSSNQSAVSLGNIPTSSLQQNNIYNNPGYYPNTPIHNYTTQVSPTNTIVSGSTGYFVSNGTNTNVPSTTHVPGNMTVLVPNPLSIPDSAEYVAMTSDLPSNAHTGSSCMVQSASFSAPDASSPDASNFPSSHQNSDLSQEPLGHHSQNLVSDENKAGEEQSDVTEKTLDVPRTPSTSLPTSPVPVRKLTMQRKSSRRSSVMSRQQSKSSGDEGPNITPPTAHKHTNVNPTSTSPGAARGKLSRKVSCTNSIGSHHNADNSINESSAGSTGGPNATSSPNTKHRTSIVHQRKTGAGLTGGVDASGGGHANAIDVSRSSSSGGLKRRDSYVPNGGSAHSGGILSRTSSLDHSHCYAGGSMTDVTAAHCAGAETTTTTCSERERTNSVSSRTSSAAGGHATNKTRKHSVCSNRGGSGSDVGKVPWCGCWGNGCI